MSESYWDIPADTGSIRTPYSMLMEQAEALTKQTRRRLIGFVEAIGVRDQPSRMSEDQLMLTLSIRVPRLNDYTYRLLEYHQPVELYPGVFNGRMFSSTDVRRVENESQFEDVLRKALTSDHAKAVVRSLLAQTNDKVA